MKILELFAGTCSFSKIAAARGHEVFTIDNDDYHDVDLVKDILDITVKDIPFTPDIVWASPPCTTFSVMSNFNYWDFPYPKNSKACINQAFVLKTIELIKELKPKFWFIENPRGLLRKFKFMKALNRNTVTYCRYGTEYMKPTDIWTNCKSWKPKAMCKNGMSCHTEARRGSKTGIQGKQGGLRATTGWSKESRVARSIVPKKLCEEILKTIENMTKSEIESTKFMKEEQQTLPKI